MIYLETMSGLGNRMRAIASILGVAAKSAHPVMVLWPVDETLRCDMDDLFRLPEDIACCSFRENRFSRTVLNGLMRLGCSRRFSNAEIKQIRGNAEDLAALFLGHKYIYVKTSQSVVGQETDYGVFDYYDNDFGVFRPSRAVEKKSRPIIHRIRQHRCIGIHIRRTDNRRAIDESPSEAFLDVMRRALEEDGDVRFYLATDAREEEATFHSEIGARHFIPKPDIRLSRKDKEGVQDAYVELLCLAATEKIYGSFFSSFSQVAAAINKIPYEITGVGKLR